MKPGCVLETCFTQVGCASCKVTSDVFFKETALSLLTISNPASDRVLFSFPAVNETVNLGYVRLGNLDLDLKICIFGFPIEHKI